MSTIAEIPSIMRNVPMSAQKARLVADQVRNQPVGRAMELLQFSNKKAAGLFAKVLKSAIANAEHNHGVDDVDSLKISTVHVDEAVTLKRFRARARGRGTRILKRTCHITLKISQGRV